MREAVCNTSPLLYLHRIGALAWLPVLFDRITVPVARDRETDGSAFRMARVGLGCRGVGRSCGGTLKILLEAKAQGHIHSIAPLIDGLIASGMWISEDVRRRILVLAGEG